MRISKIYSGIAAISLLGLASAPQVWAQESGGEVESFNRSLGLEGMGTDLASVEHEIEHGSPANAPEPSDEPGGKKAPREKRAPVERTQSFSDLAFSSNPAVTSTMRSWYISHVNAATLLNTPSYDTLISRFDRRFDSYGFSRHNVGDTFAGYMIVVWEILHNTDASSNPAGIRRIRSAVCQIMEKRGKAAQLASENKQKASEALKCLAELGSEEIRRARQTNNQATIRQMQNQLTLPLRNYGIDLSRFRLTDKGFVNG
jgi:hypothetical protein